MNAKAGVEINQEVLTNLEEINGQVKKVSQVMREITVASEEQSSGVQHINAPPLAGPAASPNRMRLRPKSRSLPPGN